MIEAVPIYQGSVKSIYDIGGDRLHFAFSDDYSVFDWGKMPDQIREKGFALTVMAASFFETLESPVFWQELASSRALEALSAAYLKNVFAGETYAHLCSHGLATHYLGLSGRSGDFRLSEVSNIERSALKLEVRKARVARPVERLIGGSSVYFYERDSAPGLVFVPLEIVFRFAAPAGSSLISRVARDPAYGRSIGLDSGVVEGQVFERPVIEFFTKLESSDRLLTYQEAALTAGLDAEEFSLLYKTSELISIALYEIFAKSGIKLSDGKIECAVERVKAGSVMGSRIVLVDSVGPDELRLDIGGVQLSKEILRHHYRKEKWYGDINEAKAEAEKTPGTKWQDIARAKGAAPEALPPNLQSAVSEMYLALAAKLSGKNLSTPPLADIVPKLAKVCGGRNG